MQIGHSTNISHLIKWTGRFLKPDLLPVCYALGLVAAATALMLVINKLVNLDHVGIGYVIPVMIAATRWGVGPAVIAALTSVGASAFFFYSPLYSFEVTKPQELVDLLMFVIVAVVTGQLTNDLRRYMKDGLRREEELKALYFLTKKLSTISSGSDIYAVIQEHLSAITECRVCLLEAGVGRSRLEEQTKRNNVPWSIAQEMCDILEGRADVLSETLSAGFGEPNWLIRALTQRRVTLGVVGIELPPSSGKHLELLRQRIDSAFAEAAATLERIDVGNAINEAKLRSQGDLLRDALIGSVSHELRTPLASIIGPASILVEAPAVARDPQLLAMASMVRDEAERLNSDIQNLLDASRISSSGVRAQPAWTEVVDVVNAALERRRMRLASHRLEAEFQDDLPLVFVDPVLVEQALSQIIDNAAKYSPPGSTITIAAHEDAGCLTIAVTDEGIGLSPEERSHMCDRFYRGPRHAPNVGGSGLGLWIAQSFVVASGGRLVAESNGPDRGTTVNIGFPVMEQEMRLSSGATDE